MTIHQVEVIHFDRRRVNIKYSTVVRRTRCKTQFEAVSINRESRHSINRERARFSSTGLHEDVLPQNDVSIVDDCVRKLIRIVHGCRRQASGHFCLKFCIIGEAVARINLQSPEEQQLDEQARQQPGHHVHCKRARIDLRSEQGRFYFHF